MVFDSPCVSKSLKSELAWDHKRVKNGPKMWCSASARELSEVLKNMFLANFVAVLWLLDTLHDPKTFGRAKHA